MKTKLAYATTVGLLLAHLLGSRAGAGVAVHGAASSSGENVTVQIHADITDPAIVSFCFKVFYDPNVLRVVSASRNDDVWYFHDGTSRVSYLSPDVSQPGEVLFVGGKMDSRNTTEGVTGNNVLLGTIVFARLNPDVPGFEVRIGRDGQFANFVTTEGVTLDAEPGAVLFASVMPDRNDRDLDGLDDSWEEQFFGSIRRSYYSDDPDKDGVNNLGEADLGSDPSDPNSNLKLTIHRKKGVVYLEWASVAGRVYAIEASDSLRRFRTVLSRVRATPPTNMIELDAAEPGDVAFYRVRLEPRAGF